MLAAGGGRLPSASDPRVHPESRGLVARGVWPLHIQHGLSVKCTARNRGHGLNGIMLDIYPRPKLAGPPPGLQLAGGMRRPTSKRIDSNFRKAGLKVCVFAS